VPLLLGRLQHQQEFLPAPQSKAGQQHMAATCNPLGDRLRQALLLGLPVWVESGPVGRLEHEQVGAAHRRRKSRLDGALGRQADVARDDDAALGSAEAQADGAGDMPGAAGMHGDAWEPRQGHWLPHWERAHLLEHALHQRRRIERQLHLLGSPALHDGERIGQHQLHEQSGGARGKNGCRGERPVQERQSANVVGVGVRHEDRPDRFPLQQGEVGQRVGLAIQPHAAVNHDPVPAQLYRQATGTDLLRSSGKDHLHSSFSSALLRALRVNAAADRLP
jgi:hypothetical protein